MNTIIYFISILFFFSCSEVTPVQEECFEVPGIEYLVLCEGMYGYDNASLWGIGNGIAKEIFRCSNNRRLGDTANDMLKVNDSIFILIVSTSNEIIKIDKVGKLLHSIQMKGEGHFIKQACVINDSVLALTDLYADKVYILNHKSMILDSLSIPGLCAPDGIAYGDGKIIICNSGYGIFRKNETNASTITIYDLNSKTYVFTKTGINPQNVCYQNLHAIVQYAHLTTEPDSVGGLQLFDLQSNNVAQIKGKYIGKPIFHQNRLICLEGTKIIALSPDFSKIDTVYNNNSNEQWYRIGIVHDQVYICNARNYTLPGYINLLNSNYTLLDQRYLVGINPSKMFSVKKD